jgi:hypothetical protein
MLRYRDKSKTAVDSRFLSIHIPIPGSTHYIILNQILVSPSQRMVTLERIILHIKGVPRRVTTAA